MKKILFLCTQNACRSQMAEGIFNDEFSGETFDLVVSLCADAARNCPFAPGMGPVEHFGFDDPAGAEGDEEERLKAFRRVRDGMRKRLIPFVKSKLKI